ncbi:ferritin family protein [Patescibacteria group bacterium]
MKTYICEICGDAYLGENKPSECPFCGAGDNYIKAGDEAKPVILEDIEISEVSLKNLQETLSLEMRANAIYLCMAGNASTYELKSMYKRLAKVELEHASLVCKIMKIEMPESEEESCSEEDVENFKATIELEEHASSLYHRFAKDSTEEPFKRMFAALAIAEEKHIELIKNYL